MHRHQAWCLRWARSFLLPWKLQRLKTVLNVAQTREFQRFFISRNRKTAFVAVSQKTLYIDFVSRWVHWNFCTWRKKGKLNWKWNPPADGGDELCLDWWADTTKYLKKLLQLYIYIYIYKNVSRSVCLSFRPGACWDVAAVGALWSDPGGHYSWRLQINFP